MYVKIREDYLINMANVLSLEVVYSEGQYGVKVTWITRKSTYEFRGTQAQCNAKIEEIFKQLQQQQTFSVGDKP